MTPHYIWQLESWRGGEAPAFYWRESQLAPQLQRLRMQQGRLLGQSESVVGEQRAAHLDALVQNALRTSEIEGETLDATSVRSSVVRYLGLERAGFIDKAGINRGSPQTDALIGLLVEATQNYQQSLDMATLYRWQAALFPEPPRFHALNIGTLRGDAPMQVVSGRLDRPVVHFEAPPRTGLEDELSRFLDWFNRPPSGLDSLLRAGIAHLWLITLHPFDDGNGRVTRAVTDRALAQAEHNSVRYYSLSAAIMARRNEYYECLETTQKGDLDVTQWLHWFLSVLEDAIMQGLQRFERVLHKARYWQKHAQSDLNERQVKVLNRLLDNWGEEFLQGINASKYMRLARVSKATATRELVDLLQKEYLLKMPGGGRSSRYSLNSEGSTSE